MKVCVDWSLLPFCLCKSEFGVLFLETVSTNEKNQDSAFNLQSEKLQMFLGHLLFARHFAIIIFSFISNKFFRLVLYSVTYIMVL